VHIYTCITAHTQEQTSERNGETMTAPQALVTEDDKPAEAGAAGMQSRTRGGNGGDVGGGDTLEVSMVMARLAARTQRLCQLALTLPTMRDREAVVRTGQHSPLQLICAHQKAQVQLQCRT
jgi:hypothetical protein